MPRRQPTNVPPSAALSDRTLLPQRIYRLRMLGFGLGMPMIGVVLLEIDAPLASWVLLLFTGVLWPQIALLVARRSREPYRAELRNLLPSELPSALVGAIPEELASLIPEEWRSLIPEEYRSILENPSTSTAPRG